MLYDKKVVAVEEAKQTGAIEKILVSKMELEQEGARMHSTFWSTYRIAEYERLLGHPPVVSPIVAKVGQAVFPCCVSPELSLLYRVVLTKNNVGQHRILTPLLTEYDYVLKLLHQFVSLDRGHVDLSIVLEPEYVEIGQRWKNVPIDGFSMGLAVRVAIESYNLDALIGGVDDDRYVFTGEIDRGSLKEIAQLVPKAKSLQKWRHQAILLSPQQQGSSQPNVIGCATLTEVFREMQGAASDWKERYHRVQNGKLDHDRMIQVSLSWFEDLQVLSLDTSSERFATRFKLRIMLNVIPAYNHLGRGTEALPLVNALIRFLGTEEPKNVQSLLKGDNENWHLLFANCAVSFLDDFEIEQGLQLYDLPLREAFDEQPLIHYQGSKASLLMANGCFQEAKALYEENITLSIENEGDPAGTELVRTLCYYGNLLRIMNRYDEAESTFKEAIEKSGDPMYDGSNSLPWVQWQYAKLLYDNGRSDEVASFNPPLPDFVVAGLQRAYPKTMEELEKGLHHIVERQNPMSKLYQSAKLRGEAQLQMYKKGSVDHDTLTKLQSLHPDWKELTYPELLQRIPY